VLPKNDPKRGEVTRNEQRCGRYLSLEPKLIAVLAGTAQPADAAERLDLAFLCGVRKMQASAVQLWIDAFAAAPKAPDDLAAQHRYNAACAAALAAAGKGVEVKKLDDQEKKRFRQQALTWLRADLAAWTRLLDKPGFNPRIREAMLHWQWDSDLVAIRDANEIAKLPPDEHEACKKLWADMTSLLQKVLDKK
jgi:hypothetical protein